MEEHAYAKNASRGGCGRHFCGPQRRHGAGADRHQIQPRRGAQHAEGQGRREVQGTRREIHQRQGEDRGLSQLVALQGQGRARGAAARRRADAGAVELEVRPDRHQRLRSVRSALHRSQQGRAAQSHRRSDWPADAQAAGIEGHGRARLLGQRLQGDERQQAAQYAGRLQGAEIPHPVVESPGGAVPRARARSRR